MIPKGSHTNTFVQRVLPWVGRLILTQRMNVEVKIEKKFCKKRVGQGMDVPRHILTSKNRMFYNNYLSDTRLECQTTKSLALNWLE